MLSGRGLLVHFSSSFASQIVIFTINYPPLSLLVLEISVKCFLFSICHSSMADSDVRILRGENIQFHLGALQVLGNQWRWAVMNSALPTAVPRVTLIRYPSEVNSSSAHFKQRALWGTRKML